MRVTKEIPEPFEGREGGQNETLRDERGAGNGGGHTFPWGRRDMVVFVCGEVLLSF